MQKLLELTSVVERLDAIERLLNGEDLEDPSTSLRVTRLLFLYQAL